MRPVLAHRALTHLQLGALEPVVGNRLVRVQGFGLWVLQVAHDAVILFEHQDATGIAVGEIVAEAEVFDNQIDPLLDVLGREKLT